MRFALGPHQAKFPNLWVGRKLFFPPCLGFAGRDVPDLSHSSGLDFTATGTASALSVIGSPIGPALSFAGNIALQQAGSASYTLPCKFLTNTLTDEFSIQAFFQYNHSAGAKESTIFWSDNPTAGSHFYGYRFYIDNNTDKLRLRVANDDGALGVDSTYYRSASTLTGGKWYSAIITWTGGGRDAAGVDLCSMWIDGVDDGYLTITNSTPSGVEEYGSHLGTQNARVGSTLGSTAPDFSVALVNVWNRELKRDEIARLSADPLAMFRRRRAAGAKASRLVSIGGTALRRMNVAIAG